MKFTAGWMAEACDGVWSQSDDGEARPPKKPVGIDTDELAIDSRTLRPGSIYLALKGDVHDGHRFTAAAKQAGAAAAIVARDRLDAVRSEVGGTFPLLVVADTLTALQALGARHRRRLETTRFVGVAGSNGKTTTKEMIAAVLARAGRTHKTTGNLNNHIGLPLSLLRVDSDHRYAVLETGMNHPGELRDLGEILAPEIGVLTTVQPEHLEGLKTIENVAKAEGELFEKVAPKGVLIFPGDEPLVRSHALPARGDVTLVAFGEGEGVSPEVGGVRLVDWQLTDDGGTQANYATPKGELVARLPQLGRHNAKNAAAAIAVGLSVGMDLGAIKSGLETAPLADRRLRIHRTDKLVVLDDCYNANPGSMSAALEVLRVVGKGKRRIAILGDMLELGSEAPREHEKLGELIGQLGIDMLCVVGEHARTMVEAALSRGMHPEAVCFAPAVAPLLAWTKPRLRAGDVVLVKGSRGMKMERVVKALGVEEAGGNH